MNNVISILKALIIFIGAFFIRKSGKDSERADNAEKNEEAIRQAKKVADDVDSMSDYDVYNELRKDWTR